MISASKKLISTIAVLLIFSGALAACIKQPKPFSQNQLLDIVWSDFRPTTSSQDRGNWSSTQISLVTGLDIVKEFSVVPISRCPGPPLPENKAIRATSKYWLVKVAPKQIDPTNSFTAPTADELIVPEPLIQQASYLIDSASGEIVARRLFCEK